MERIRTLLGRPEEVVAIHGGLLREERRKAQGALTQDSGVSILVATDAAGEGINLQRAHSMINYDPPNPNPLEQRHRIHRIGQTEVCHLWNLVAEETREADVYATLLRKLRRNAALGGAVFDVIGQAIGGKELRRLMLDAIRYGLIGPMCACLNEKVQGALDRRRLRDLMESDALAQDVMDTSKVHAIRRDMERMEARRLQPHYIETFFRAAFERLGGSLHEREPGRYEITHVPAVIRQRDRLIGAGAPVLARYQRICFDKDLRFVQGKPQAEFVCPGHPLLDAVVDLILERHRDLMRQGAILVDERDDGDTLRALFYLEHAIRDGRSTTDRSRREISRFAQFVEIVFGFGAGSAPEAEARDAGMAPYLDYRAPAAPRTRLVGALQ